MTLMFYLFIPVTSGAPAAFSVSSFPVAGLLLLIFVFNIIYIEKELNKIDQSFPESSYHIELSQFYLFIA